MEKSLGIQVNNIFMTDIEKLKEILNQVNYVSMATVNEDGSPHNSPLVFMFDKNLEYIYWGSHPDSQHSKNILRTGEAFFAAFDGVNKGNGAYIETDSSEIVPESDLDIAVAVHNHFRNRMGKDSLDKSYYAEEKPQKMWRAKVKRVWINDFERGADGRLVRDYKIEIDLKDTQNFWK